MPAPCGRNDNRPGRRIDVRGTAHGHAIDAITAADRDWFDRHPGETARYRPAAAHEFCSPAAFPDCVPAFRPPAHRGAKAELRVEVRQLGPGVRFRRPYWVLSPEAVA
jgi:hypothetical protein